MEARLLFTTLALLPSYVASVGFTCEGPRTQRSLLANLTADYDPKERPHSDGPPVEVEVEIYLTSLTEINQKGQKLGVAGYFRTWWTDPRLEYTSKSEGGCVDRVHLTEKEREKIWQPDLYFDNVLEETYGADLFLIYSSGEVWKSQRVNHLYECKMDFRRLPYDRQVCSVVIASYSEDASQVRVSPRGGNKGLQLPEENPDTTVWDIDTVNSYREFRPLVNGTGWTYVHLEIILRRRPDYYMRGIVLKAVLFVIISWCSFFVNRSVAPARVAIGVIPVLIMINLMNAVDAFLPPISYSTTLTNFLMTCLVFTSSSVFEYAVVAYLLQREVWYGEKSKVLLKLSTSYLKKKEQAPQPKESIQIPREIQIPQEEKNVGSERSMYRTGGSRLWSAVSSDVASFPSNIFQQHPVLTEIYKEFDCNRNGRFSVKEMRQTLRRFGQYRSTREVREMFEKLGVDGDEMDLVQLEQFLADPNTYTPVDPTKRSFWDMPPSLQIDIAMRFIYPFAFIIICTIIGASVA